MTTDNSTSNPLRARPVFISSTFKDMQAERSYLQHVVFPRLEEELRKGRLLLEPIDLRQGVETAELASEEARERLVLKVCLEEIQRSRPFLIVLLGDRYGWVPPEERMLAATQEMGFNTEVRDKSVTALEIEFGILKQASEQRRRSFFYIRDPLPYMKMPADVRTDYSDEFSTDSQTRARHGRLAELKKSLSDDPELAQRVHRYRTNWDSVNHKVIGLDGLDMEWEEGEKWFGELVYQHLLGELQDEFAAAASQPPQTWGDQERSALLEFVEHRRRDFTGRVGLLDELQALATSPTTGPLAITSGAAWGACLTGDPGSGKSAIFAELFVRLSEHARSGESHESSDDSILLLTNAAGATPRGSQIEAMLERFIEELADAIGIANPLPEKASPDDVDATFASLLGRVAVKRRVVVLLDALNQFSPTPRAQHLTWLRPKQWPGNARLIATSLVGQPVDALSQWTGIEELEVPALTNTGLVIFESDSDGGSKESDGKPRKLKVSDDVDAIAHSVYQRYHRAVNPAVLQSLKEKRLSDDSFAASNPLWLTLALEQINLLDADDFARAERDFATRPTHERVTAMLIDTAQQLPPTVAELYQLLLAQSEKLFGAPLTSAFAAVIAVSRFGWRESDLLALIPTAAGTLNPGEPVVELNDLRLAVLRRSFRAHLARRGALGQLDFFHAQMREAIELHLLKDSSKKQTLHRTIADHLESLPPSDPLRDSELMVHLIAGDDRPRAARVYADVPKRSPAFTYATQALAQHVLLGSRDQSTTSTNWVTTLLTQLGLTGQQVANLVHRFNFDLHNALENTANLASRIRILQAAKSAIQWAARADVGNVGWQRYLSTSNLKIGDVLSAQGELAAALSSYRASLDIGQRLTAADQGNAEWQRNLAISQSRIGTVLSAQGDLASALTSHRESLGITLRLSVADPINADLQGSVSLSQEKMGDVLSAQGDLPAALQAYSASHKICERLVATDPGNAEWQRNLSISNDRVGDVANAQGDLTAATQAYRASQEILERLVAADSMDTRCQSGLSVNYNKIGSVLQLQGDLTAAMAAYLSSLEIRQQLAVTDPGNAEWQRNLSVSHVNIGDILSAQGILTAALASYRASVEISQRLAEADPGNAGWQHDLSVSQERLGNVFTAQEDLPAARAAYQSSLEIRQQLAATDPGNADWQRGLSVSYIKIGDVSSAHGDLNAARAAYQASLEIRQRLVAANPRNAVWRKDVASSLMQLGAVSDSSSAINAYYRQCLDCLEDMRAAEMQLDADSTRVHRYLSERFGGSKGPLASIDGSGDGRKFPSRTAVDGNLDQSSVDQTAVKLLKAGKLQKAFDLMQRVVFPRESMSMDHNAALDVRVAFLHALMLADNAAGLQSHLPTIPEQHDPRIKAIAEAFAAWRKGLTFLQRIGVSKCPPLPLPNLPD